MINLVDVRNGIQLIVSACANLRLLPITEELPSCSVDSARVIVRQVVRLSNLLDIDLHAVCCSKMDLNEQKYPVELCNKEVRKR